MSVPKCLNSWTQLTYAKSIPVIFGIVLFPPIPLVQFVPIHPITLLQTEPSQAHLCVTWATVWTRNSLHSWNRLNLHKFEEYAIFIYLWLSRVFYSNQNYQKKPVLPISPRWQNLFLSLPVQFPSLKPSQPMYYGLILQSHILAPSLKEANCQWIQNLWTVSNITMKQWVQYFILPFLKWESKPVFVSKGHPVPAHGILMICRNYQTEEIPWSGYAP